jgi:hypothetical protein
MGTISGNMTKPPYNESEKIREREKAENAPAIEKAKQTGKAVTFIAQDGCEVTAMPSGDVFYNASDWW